jgi:hypothetical protein
LGGPTGAPAGVGGGGGISSSVPLPAEVVCRGVGVAECSDFSSEKMPPKNAERTDGIAGMRLSRPLGFGVVCPDRAVSSSEERVPWVVVENARSSAEAGLLVGARLAVLMTGVFGLEDQKAGMVAIRDGQLGR